MATPNLQFGNKKVDTSLAEEYLKTNKEYYPIGNNSQSTKEGVDPCGNKIHFNNIHDDNNLIRWLQLHAVKQEYFMKLSQLIKKKAELISQLDYMIRKNPVDETKLYMSLIEQQFTYWSQFEPDYKLGSVPETLILTEQSSLLLLGRLPKALYSGGVIIIAAKEVAVISHLFIEMCHDVGLKNVMVSFADDEEITTYAIKEISGCVGVVTEMSDMESALDAFIASTTTAPWKLKKIWVQECVYEEFKQALARKCNIKRNKANANQAISDNEFIVEGKRLIIDYAGDLTKTTSENLNIITVAAYRTAKELISLINVEDNFLSLWSSILSEVNEIAFAVSTPVVWINDYGCFHGPPKATQAIFSDIHENVYQYRKTWLSLDKTCVNNFNVKLNNWKKLSNDKRKETIHNVLVKLIYDENEDLRDDVCKLVNEIVKPDPYKFIEVENGKICIGIDTVPNYVMYFAQLENPDKCLQILLHGCSCVVNVENLKSHYVKIFDALNNAGVPITSTEVKYEANTEDCDKLKIGVVPYSICLLETRVITSNYGTIFAN